MPGAGRPLFQAATANLHRGTEASVDTLHNRPLVNTRDEPHATPSRFRRLHVICGDAKMAQDVEERILHILQREGRLSNVARL